MRFTISFIEKDVQLITLIIIVNWSVWLLCTVKVASKFILYSLLRLYYFNLLYGTLSLSWTPLPPPPSPPIFFPLNDPMSCCDNYLDIKCGTKDRHWCEQKCCVQFLNLPAALDDHRCLHPLSPEEAPRTSSWRVGELITEMCMHTCNCLV